jgi:hypothetical protein
VVSSVILPVLFVVGAVFFIVAAEAVQLVAVAVFDDHVLDGEPPRSMPQCTTGAARERLNPCCGARGQPPPELARKVGADQGIGQRVHVGEAKFADIRGLVTV